MSPIILNLAVEDAGYRLATYNKMQANYLLARNKCNRTLKPVQVKRYTRIMNAGDWGQRETAVLISPQEELLGGQHGLTAFVRSNLLTIQFLTKFNATAEDRTWQNLPQATANQADRLLMYGEDMPKIRDFKWVRGLLSFISLAAEKDNIWSSQAMTDGEAARLIRSWSRELLAVEEKLSGKCAMYAPVAAGFAIAHRCMTPGIWESAAKRVSTGIGLFDSDPIHALRTAHAQKNMKGEGQSKIRPDMFKKTLIALQRVNEGLPLRKLQVNEGGMEYWRARLRACAEFSAA